MRDYNSKKPSVKKMAVRRPPAKETQPAKRNAGKKPSACRKNTPRAAAAKAMKSVPQPAAKQVKKADNLKIIPIGGLNEIGKNLTVLEYKDQILLIDCGMTFPEEEMYGIDVVIPDFSYLVKNANKLVGMVITHGHEDHIGGVPYLLKQVNVPIYGTRLTLGLIENKLKEHGLRAKLHTIKAGEKFSVGNFKIEAIRTTHSIADAICLYIQTPAATLFHTGDFKIDYTPIDGEPIDLSKFAEVGRRGVDIMLADSTNVLRKGYTPSERRVGETLDGIFREAKGRIIIATFSSNVHRVQRIIELAAKYGRKVAVSGRSMDNVVNLAIELGYLRLPAGIYVDLNKTKNIPDSQLVIVTTGSQGEPMSALSRMANNEHRNVKLKKGDMVIFSSSPVPGNEKTVTSVVNRLYEKEVEVIYNDIADIHVSGHACQEELKLIHTLIKPKFFMPVHGEYRHLVQHARLAESIGMRGDRIFILSNGDQLSVDKRNANKFQNVVSAEDILVDGLGVGDVGNIVLRDRKLLSESGLIIVVAAIDRASGEIISGPDIVSRGFVYVRENEDLIKDAREVALQALEESIFAGNRDWNAIKNSVREEMRRFIFRRTKRDPIILPIFLDV
ncbi:RNase J family beta-CASP ribonuclease [Ihubacter sp. rT4E-8]|uniref:ribonuclease J n=1 Tax=unclassified Ihubacter TaxID=2633299 RepID=UPI003C79D3CC